MTETSRLVRGARIMDPVSGFDEVADMAIEGGRILALGNIPGGFSAHETIDARGLVACPGFVDTSFQAHAPGHGRNGDMASELRAAAAGGVTTVVLRPDTAPIADQPGVLHEQRYAAESAGTVHVLASGALTPSLEGGGLTEMAALRDAGAAVFSQGLHPVRDGGLLRLALTYAADLGLPVFLHPEDAFLAGEGVINEGPTSLRLGLSGRPIGAEDAGIERDLQAARLAGAQVHFPHLSSAYAVRRVARARSEGQAASCGASIHHLLLSDYDTGYFNTRTKILPPLRSLEQRDALRVALADGLVQALTSQHCPWGRECEGRTFARAPFGIAAVEWLLPLGLRLVDDGTLSLMGFLRLVSTGPAEILGLPAPAIQPGAIADICLFDPQARHILPAEGWSRGRNHPYAGWDLRGQVRHTFCTGRQVFRFTA